MIGHLLSKIAEASVSAEITEDIFPSRDESLYICHEIKLVVGLSHPLVLWSHELEAVLSVLIQAKDLAARRAEEFYANEEVFLSTTTL